MIVASGTMGASDARLSIAVPKGALFDDAVAAFEAAGLDVAALRSPGRTLIVRTDDVEFVISKPTDIPAYVAYGAVDVAVAGKDVLVEANLDVVELVDLGFGACRFVVAEPKGARGSVEERYRHVGVVRVATKYPSIAETHYAKKGIQAEVVKLSGNIEIAPLIGLADQIVDITATGRTLEENELRIVEEVMASTARFVANPISLRTKADRVTGLAERLAGAARGETRR